MIELTNVSKRNYFESISLTVSSPKIIEVRNHDPKNLRQFFSIISGINSKSKGNISIAGNSFSDLNILPPSHLTSMEYLLLISSHSSKQTDHFVYEWLYQFDLHELAEERLAVYTEDQLKRIQILSAIVTNANILCFHLPFDSLDQSMRQLVSEQFTKLKEDGKVIFYSTLLEETDFNQEEVVFI